MVRVVTGATGLSGTAGVTSASVATSETTTSATYTNLATVGPTVTVTIPASGRALVILTAEAKGSQGGSASFMSYAASPAGTSGGPADAQAYEVAGNDFVRASATVLVSGLTPGSTTFTAKYRVSSGTGTFGTREITVIPLS